MRDVGFAGLGTDPYALAANSPFAKAGEGGVALGADVAEIRRLTEGVKP